MKCYRNRHT